VTRPVTRTLRRRDLLAGAAVCLAGCDTGHPDRGILGAMTRWNGAVQAALFRPRRSASSPIEEETTPLSAFPAYKIGDDYPAPPVGWALEIGGMVERPRRFDVSDLQQFARSDVRVRHHCVEGWSAVATWHGVRLRDIAEAVSAHADARYVEFVSFELVPGGQRGLPSAGVHDAKAPNEAPIVRASHATYTSSWDRASALHPQTLLTYGINGSPLGRLRGGPVRVYSSVKLGYKMVKWLSSVRFLPEPTGGYWEDMGYEWFAGV
jgi:DMSO/TMAO reductase YedYZ molybdopterin-dependent catalytic subunit